MFGTTNRDGESELGDQKTHHGGCGEDDEPGGAADESPRWAAFRSMLNASLISTGLMATFFGFSVCQNTATTQDREYGSTALGILYCVFTVSNLFSAYVVVRVGLRLSLVAASGVYILFCLANMRFRPPFLYPASALVGISAAILWTAQGGVITKCAFDYERALRLQPRSSLGWFQGLFFAVYQSSALLGNMTAFILLFSDQSRDFVYLIMTIVCGIGTCLLLGLRLQHRSSPRERSNTGSIPCSQPRLKGRLGDSFLIPEYRLRENSWDESVFSVSRVEGWSQSSGGHESFANYTANNQGSNVDSVSVAHSTSPFRTQTTSDLKYLPKSPESGASHLLPQPISTPAPRGGRGRAASPGPRSHPHSPTHHRRSAPHKVRSSGGNEGKEGYVRGSINAVPATVWPVSTLRLLTSDRELQKLLFAAAYNGGSLAFIVAEYPLLIQDHSVRYLGLALCGLTNMVSSHFFGWLSDKISREIIIAFGFLVHAAIYAVLLNFVSEMGTKDETFVLVGALYGIGDAILNTQSYVAISMAYGAEGAVEPAFASFKMVQALAASCAFFLHTHLSWTAKVLTLLTLLTLSSSLLTLKVRDIRHMRRRNSEITQQLTVEGPSEPGSSLAPDSARAAQCPVPSNSLAAGASFWSNSVSVNPSPRHRLLDDEG